jgi:hypothetical protein
MKFVPYVHRDPTQVLHGGGWESRTSFAREPRRFWNAPYAQSYSGGVRPFLEVR